MKTKTIDELLAWAFVHELLKGGGVDGLDNMNSAWRMLQASSWGKVLKWAELMATIDEGHRFDHDNFLLEQGEPHEDAIEVGRAVAALAECEIVIPDGWSPLADWPDHDARMPALKAEAVARAVERFMLRTPARRAAHLVSLVVGTAILGREPVWEAPVPSIRMVERAGRPAWFILRRMRDELGRERDIEVEGFNAKTSRPLRGAYRKFEFSDDPVSDVLARLDRELWAVALRHVQGEVANRLIAHRLADLHIPWRPWGESGPALALIAGQGIAAKKTA